MEGYRDKLNLLVSRRHPIIADYLLRYLHSHSAQRHKMMPRLEIKLVESMTCNLRELISKESNRIEERV